MSVNFIVFYNLESSDESDEFDDDGQGKQTDEGPTDQVIHTHTYIYIYNLTYVHTFSFAETSISFSDCA